jgi:hypothetical protein
MPSRRSGRGFIKPGPPPTAGHSNGRMQYYCLHYYDRQCRSVVNYTRIPCPSCEIMDTMEEQNASLSNTARRTSSTAAGGTSRTVEFLRRQSSSAARHGTDLSSSAAGNSATQPGYPTAAEQNQQAYNDSQYSAEVAGVSHGQFDPAAYTTLPRHDIHYSCRGARLFGCRASFVVPGEACPACQLKGA